MDLINLTEGPIEIINPGNGLPGISPCFASAQDANGGGGGGGDSRVPPLPVVCYPQKTATGW